MADFAVLKADCDSADAAKAVCVHERTEKRLTMTKAEFIQYNDVTRPRQIEVQKAVDHADKVFRDAIQEVRNDAVAQVIDVGPLTEGNVLGGTGG